MKKTLALVLALVLAFSLTSVAMATPEADKGTPPGHEDPPGTSTEVTYEVSAPVVTTESKTDTEDRLTGTRVETGTPVISKATVVDYNNILGIVDHPSQYWTANLYATTITTTTTTPQTQIDTYAVFNVEYERTVTTTYIVKRTITHHGAPGSNGVIISDVSVTDGVNDVAYGEWVEVSATEIADSSYDVSAPLADLVTTAVTNTTTQGEWIKPQGTPSTAPQKGGDDNKNKNKK